GSLVPVVAAFDVSFTRFLVDVAALPDAMFLLRRQLHSNGVGDLARERSLQDHDVTNRSFVPFRPEVLLGADLDHLRADAHAFGGTEHRACDERVDAQLPSNLRRSLMCLLE